MKSVTIKEAESNFPAVLRLVRAGEEVELTHRKAPVAKIIPLKKRAHKYDWSASWAKVEPSTRGSPRPASLEAESLLTAGGETLLRSKLPDCPLPDRAFVEEQDQPLLLNELQELEFKNGLRQKVLRKEITESELVRGILHITS